MKKSLFCFKNIFAILIFSFLPGAYSFSQSLEGVNVTSTQETSSQEESDENVPVLLEGIWENSTRYVIFDSGYVSRLSSRRIPSVALKAFYGWYVDRTAESNEYSLNNPRPSNDTTSKTAQQLELHFTPITDELYSSSEASYHEGYSVSMGKMSSGAWDMEVKYPGFKETYHIPVAVIGNNLYIKFLIRSSTEVSSGSEGEKEKLQGFWQDSGSASGIKVSPPVLSDELLSYYVSGEYVYHIRYWVCDMDYDSETKAAFSDGNETFYVPKHIMSGDRVFTCVAGRSRNIRNIERSEKLPEKYELNDVFVSGSVTDESGLNAAVSGNGATIMGIGEPYLVLVEGSRTFEDILEEAALRKAPSPAPVFPPHGLLDFDWSIIEDPPATYDRRMLDLGK